MIPIVPSDSRESGLAVPQLVLRPREHVTDVDRLAGVRVWDETLGCVFVLTVEHARQGRRAPTCRRVRRRVGNELPVDPHGALRGAETVEELGSRSCCHGGIRPDIGRSRKLLECKAGWQRIPGRSAGQGSRPHHQVPRRDRQRRRAVLHRIQSPTEGRQFRRGSRLAVGSFPIATGRQARRVGDAAWGDGLRRCR